MSQPERTELTTWKEVAAYLGVSTRTAQNWERDRGLPVKRFPGVNGRVRALTADIDAWKDSPAAGVKTTAPARRWWLAGAAAALILAGAAALFLATRPGPPASFRVDGDSLIVTDENRRELWRKRFEFTLASERFYRDNQSVWFGDLDADGRTEVLFAPTGTQAQRNIPLYCYSRNGEEKWRRLTERQLSTRKEAFQAIYMLHRFVVAPVGPGGSNAVVTASVQYPYYPSQVALLSPKGEWLGEYSHSGHLNRLLVADVDLDGRLEIVAGGISNSYQTATLVVLDPADLQGASAEENADYQLLGLPPGREKARILFSRSCVNRATNPFNQAYLLEMHRRNLLVHVVEDVERSGADVVYEFEPGLTLKSVSDSSQFRFEHEKLEQAGKADHSWKRDLEDLRRGIRFLTRPGDGRNGRLPQRRK